MTNHPLPERAKNFTAAHLGLVDQQIHTLVTLLLERLLDEVGDIRHAAVLIEAAGATPGQTSGEPFARVDRAPGPGDGPEDGPDDGPDDLEAKRIDVSTELAGGARAVLLISAGDDRERTGDVARRYLSPIAISLDLLDFLQTERDRAQDAVHMVESTALLDLATGILMARRPMDPRSARTVLRAWCERTGTQLEDLSPEAVLDLLTVEEL